MKYRPEQIERFGLEPYAIYGGYVYSFKCKATGDRIYDAVLLDSIFTAAQNQASKLIDERNKHD